MGRLHSRTRSPALLPDLPIHVALVHVPLGGAVLVPVIAAILVAAPREDRRTWIAGFALQALVVLSGIIAAAAGEKDALSIQYLVDNDAIQTHETAARIFLTASAVTLVAFAAGLWGRTPQRRRRAAAAALLLGLVAAVLGVRAGHLGGDLVFGEGAVRAHEQGGQLLDQ